MFKVYMGFVMTVLSFGGLHSYALEYSDSDIKRAIGHGVANIIRERNERAEEASEALRFRTFQRMFERGEARGRWHQDCLDLYQYGELKRVTHQRIPLPNRPSRAREYYAIGYYPESGKALYFKLSYVKPNKFPYQGFGRKCHIIDL